MNKEELLQKTRNEVAKKEYGCRTWTTLYRKYIEEKPDLIILAMEIAMQRYAVSMCEAQKEACAEKISDLDVDALKTVLTTKNVAE